MIKNIIGLIRPDSGQILYDGRDLLTMNKHELNMLRREMGMLFQGSALFDSMTDRSERSALFVRFNDDRSVGKTG